MLADIEARLRRGNKVLFSRDSECLQDLISLIMLQKHQTLVLWAFDCVQVPLEKFESRYPEEPRPRAAVEKCRAWARGEIIMPPAKRAILDAHAVAKEIDDPVFGALCHAVGHAGATVHVETHGLGLVFYELTALVLENRENYEAPVLDKIRNYQDRLLCWQEHTGDANQTWASFLLDDSRPNKEKQLAKKQQQLKEAIQEKQVQMPMETKRKGISK
jgi:hypothetical protein